MEEKVSIILPVYNCESYIDRCIESILNQTYKNIEIVIVNDGSIDKTDEIIKKYSLKDERIKYFIQENLGPSITRNRAIEKSTGKYILFVDSDDRINDLYVKLLVEAIEESDAEISCCGYIDESKYGILELNDFWKNKDILNKHDFIECVCNGVGGVLWGKIFKADIIKDNNINMDSKLYMSEDLVFVLEYCQYVSRASVINENLYHYNRLNEKSISSNVNIKYLENYSYLIEKTELLLSILGMEEKYIKNINRLKVQSLVMRVVESETLQYILNKSFKEFNQNIESLISSKLVKTYISKFKSEDKINTIIINLLNKKRYKELLIFDMSIIRLIKFKNIILRRIV